MTRPDSDAPGTIAAPPRPYAHSRELFDDHGVRLLLYLKHYLLRFWPRLTDASGNLNDLYVSLSEALQALDVDPQALGVAVPPVARPAHDPDALPRIEGAIRRWNERIAERLSLSMDGQSLTTEDLRALFGLDDVEMDVILTLARIQSDLEFCRLCTFAWADFTRKQPYVSFLLDLLAVPAGRRKAVVEALRPEGRLVRHRLVLLHDAGDWVPRTPHFFQHISIADRIGRFLLDEDRGAAEAGLPFTLVTEAPAPERLCLAPDVLNDVVAAVERARRVGPGRSLVALYGHPGVGRTTLAAGLTRRLGKALLVVAAEPLLARSPAELRATLGDCLREALLRDAVPLIELGAGLGDGPEHRDTRDAFARALDTHRGHLFLTAAEAQPWLSDLAEVQEVFLPFTSKADQRRAWQEALSGEVQLKAGVNAPYLAARFNLTAGQIHRAVAEVAGHGRRRHHPPGGAGAPGAREVGEAEMVAAVRKLVRHQIGTLATPSYTELDWDDVVLEREVVAQLKEIEKFVQHQDVVFDRWQLRRLAGGRRGTAALFSGPPGTGKTLAATLLGKTLGRDVFQIDLSRIVDKYVGETEKNLKRLFDESEYAQVILLFDEADALFAKRTAVQTSNDRYANLEVSFLLQRIETFNGICILTTNHEENIDVAFKRRLRYRVRFPAPDADLREALWRSMLAHTEGIEEGIPWKRLARDFEFSGGHIRNAVLRAAFAAAAEGRRIGGEHLQRAALAEARELGQLVRDDAGL